MESVLVLAHGVCPGQMARCQSWKMINPNKCRIIDRETGEICEKPWHGPWPCCYDHGQEYRAYLDQWREGFSDLLDGGAWASWRRQPGQQSFFSSADGDAAKPRWPEPRLRFLPGGLPCFHESTSDVLTASCAYCGTTLHAHRDELGRVKSGRLGTGYLEEKCPACHRANAVFPTYGDTAIRTTRLVEGAPAIQMKLR